MNDNVIVDIRLDADDSLVLTVLMPAAPRVGDLLWPARSTPTGQERFGAFEVLQVAHHCRPSGIYSCVAFTKPLNAADTPDVASLTTEELYEARMDCYYAAQASLEADLWSGNAATDQAHAARNLRDNLRRMELFDAEIARRKTDNA